MDSRQTVADEFCLMEPLVSTNEPIDDDADDVIAESGISIGMRCLSMGKQEVQFGFWFCPCYICGLLLYCMSAMLVIDTPEDAYTVQYCTIYCTAGAKANGFFCPVSLGFFFGRLPTAPLSLRI